MAKPRKEAQPLSIRMDKPTFDRLNEYCEDSGQSKTIAIERAVNLYIDAYEDKNGPIEQKNKK